MSDGYDAVVNGEKVASVSKGWSRVGGAGWQFCIANCGISLTKKSLEDARRSIADKLSAHEIAGAKSCPRQMGETP